MFEPDPLSAERAAFLAASDAVRRGTADLTEAERRWNASLSAASATWTPTRHLAAGPQRALDAWLDVFDEFIGRQVAMLAALDVFRRRAGELGGLEPPSDADLDTTRVRLVAQMETIREAKRTAEGFRGPRPSA